MDFWSCYLANYCEVPMTTDRYLRRAEVPAFLREHLGVSVTAGILAKMASQGEGPPFVFWGRIPAYSESVTLAWGRSHLTAKPVHLGAILPAQVAA
jgi:hypothetical protein